MVIDYERGFSSPIGAFIFLIKSNEIFSYYDSNKFSSPIGAFIFLINCIDKFMKWCEEFSSPIGAFIFLIKDLCYVEYSGNQVFVPYRGFYFLNVFQKLEFYLKTMIKFSSPIGAFIFLI